MRKFFVHLTAVVVLLFGLLGLCSCSDGSDESKAGTNQPNESLSTPSTQPKATPTQKSALTLREERGLEPLPERAVVEKNWKEVKQYLKSNERRTTVSDATRISNAITQALIEGERDGFKNAHAMMYQGKITGIESGDNINSCYSSLPTNSIYASSRSVEANQDKKLTIRRGQIDFQICVEGYSLEVESFNILEEEVNLRLNSLTDNHIVNGMCRDTLSRTLEDAIKYCYGASDGGYVRTLEEQKEFDTRAMALLRRIADKVVPEWRATT